jgi:enoyl-CoA hydratase
LVHRIAEGDPVQAAIAFARGFSVFGQQALRLARDAVKRALEVPLQQGLAIEADLNTLAFQTQDAVEGMSAFVEKRKPKFQDR